MPDAVRGADTFPHTPRIQHQMAKYSPLGFTRYNRTRKRAVNRWQVLGAVFPLAGSSNSNPSAGLSSGYLSCVGPQSKLLVERA